MYWPFRSYWTNARCTIYVPCLANSEQQDLARWYHEGLNAFEQTCPIGIALFEQYETLLKVRSENKADFEQLIRQTQKQAEMHCV